MMLQINGHKITEFNFSDLKKVSDLIYFDGPVLSHYTNAVGEHLIMYWSDGDENVNRWILYKIPLIFIHEYIEKKVSLADLFRTKSDISIVVVDIDSEQNITDAYITDYKSLPSSYTPKASSYYAFKPLVNEDIEEYYLNISETGVLQAIFKNNKAIGYGTIPMKIFSPTIHYLNEINLGLGFAYYNRKKKENHTEQGNIRKAKINKEETLIQTQFEIAGFAPGSFKLILRPLTSQKAIGDNLTESDNYFNFFFEFIAAGFDYEKLQKVVAAIPSEVIANFERLLKSLEFNKVDFLLKWSHPSSNSKNEFLLAHKSVHSAIENINKLEYENHEELKLRGRFVELNLITKHYTFIQDGDSEKIESRGHFDSARMEGIVAIQFIKNYDVIIMRTESKQAGNRKSNIKDILISFIEN